MSIKNIDDIFLFPICETIISCSLEGEARHRFSLLTIRQKSPSLRKFLSVQFHFLNDPVNGHVGNSVFSGKLLEGKSLFSVQSDDLLLLLLIQDTLTSKGDTFVLGFPDPVHLPCLADVMLEFCKRPDNVEHQSPFGCGGVDGLVEDFKGLKPGTLETMQ